MGAVDDLVFNVKVNMNQYMKEDNDHKDIFLGYSKEALRGSKDFTNLLLINPIFKPCHDLQTKLHEKFMVFVYLSSSTALLRTSI